MRFGEGIDESRIGEVFMRVGPLFPSIFLIHVLLLATGCGNRIPPPGGPVDDVPPGVVSIEPDSNATGVDLKSPVRVEFDEEIMKDRRGDVFTLSPVHERLRVRYGWHSIEARPEGGLYPDCTYRVRLSERVSDLRGNVLGKSLSYCFSTGDSLYGGTIEGKVELREDFEGNVVFQALFLPDSLVYRTDVDEEGRFALDHMPRGPYRLLAFLDTRRDGIHDPAEEYGEVKEAELEDGVLEVMFPFQVPE